MIVSACIDEQRNAWMWWVAEGILLQPSDTKGHVAKKGSRDWVETVHWGLRSGMEMMR